MNTTLTGREGEAKAAAYLRKKRYDIIGANYRCRFGELDLIAKKGELVVFVEVKLRKNDRFGAAADAVTASKREKLRKAAMFLFYRKNCFCQGFRHGNFHSLRTGCRRCGAGCVH